MYDKGQGVPINGRTAVRYYNQAMQRGHTGAMCNLGYKVCPARTHDFLTTHHNTPQHNKTQHNTTPVFTLYHNI